MYCIDELESGGENCLSGLFQCYYYEDYGWDMYCYIDEIKPVLFKEIIINYKEE